MKRRTLILTIDATEKDEWQIKALQNQMGDYLKANKTVMPCENMIIMPTKGETKLFWLEGDVSDPRHLPKLEEIRDRLKPVLEVSMGIKEHKRVRRPRAKGKNKSRK